MLYYLFRLLEQFGVPGSGMWSYISFRSLLALMLALVISAWFGERFIRWMKKRKISETQRDASIDPFGVKKLNVPTMGGIIIIVATLVPCLLLGRLRNIYMLLMIFSTVSVSWMITSKCSGKTKTVCPAVSRYWDKWGWDLSSD